VTDVYLKKNNRIVAIGVCENKMFSMVLITRPLQQADQANVAVKNLTLLQWHEILSHQNVQYVRSYLKHADSIHRNKKQIFLRSLHL